MEGLRQEVEFHKRKAMLQELAHMKLDRERGYELWRAKVLDERIARLQLARKQREAEGSEEWEEEEAAGPSSLHRGSKLGMAASLHQVSIPE